MNWGDWIIQVAGLDGGRWNVPGGQQGSGLLATYHALNKLIPGDRTIQPMGNTITNGKAARGGCGAVLAVSDGYMVFAPNALATGGTTPGSGNTFKSGDFCSQLRDSYKSSGGPGNKVVPLASTGTVEF